MAIPIIPALMGMIGGAGVSMGMTAPPVGRTLQYVTNNWVPNLRPDIGQLVEMRHRNMITQDAYETAMRYQGAEKDLAVDLYSLARPLIQAGDLITLHRRGELSPEVFEQEMKKLGYAGDAINRLLKVTEFFPMPADLVRFAVREVYTPTVRAEYGMDEDYPTIFETEAAKGGMTPDQAKNFWAAHWELPSINMGYEMFQRTTTDPTPFSGSPIGKVGEKPLYKVMDEEHLETLLKTLDVMPAWRNLLMRISYAPFTRVDVRRMYRDKVLNVEEVNAAYHDIGYDDWKSGKLTDWTIAQAEGTERELTRTMILQGYEDGQITKKEAAAYLERLRYDVDEVDFILTLKDTDIAEKEQKEQIQAYQAMYRSGKTEDAEFMAQLDGLNLRAAYRDKIFYSTVRERRIRVALPTRPDLENWFRRGIIDLPQYDKKMQLLGYIDEDIVNYVAAMNKLPNTKDLKWWLILEVIDHPTWVRYMTGLGYGKEEVDRYFAAIVAEIGEIPTGETGV